MNTKRGILFVIPALAVIAVLLLLWTQETVLAAEQTYTIDDEASYTKLREALNYQNNVNAGAVTFSDDTHTITIDFEKVDVFNLSSCNHLSEQAQDFINLLFLNSQNLSSITLDNVALGKIDLSNLNGKTGLTQLTVTECRLESVPDIELPGLTYLNMSENKFSANDACASLKKANFPSLTDLILSNCELTSVPNIELEITSLVLSKNNFSASGACNNLDSTHFSKLSKVWLDSCQISDVNFLLDGYIGRQLTVLSLATNNLTNNSLNGLIALKNELAYLQELNVGCKVWTGSGTTNSGGYNSNKITDIGRLASLFRELNALTSLDVSGLGITSLQDFSYVKDLGRTVTLYADYNKIIDFAGLENLSGTLIYLYNQHSVLPGKFNPGEEYEIPALIQRILDQNDVLKGTLVYENCSLSDDGKKLVIEANAKSACVTVKGGELNGSKIDFSLRSIPLYTIPQGLTATVGDTLAKVTLPSGFTWKDATMNVGAEGTNTFEAVYTPRDTDNFLTVSVNIPVKVTDPNKPTEPATEPTKPTEPATDPTEPVKPTEPATDPTQPTEPAKPTEPATEPTNPVVPTEPVTDPTEPTKPAEPVTEPTAAPSDEYDEEEEDETEAAGAVAAAKTSDTSPVVPVTVVMLVSGMILCFMISDKKKRFHLNK